MARVTLGALRSIDLDAVDVSDPVVADAKASVERCLSPTKGAPDGRKFSVCEAVAALIPVAQGDAGGDANQSDQSNQVDGDVDAGAGAGAGAGDAAN